MHEAPSLAKLVGRVVGMRVPIIHHVKTIHAKVHGVESSGLWIESPEITELLLRTANQEASPKTLVLFFPFSEIDFVMEFVETAGSS